MNENRLSRIFSANENFAERKYPEVEHQFRSPFERDRDRILYSKEFRRLNRKTQVFISGFDDHTRNRLTHTIEVAQISQTIATHLGLNITLTQAIAYGHDVGHTPFGHVGERTLNHFMNGCFKYNDFNQSIKYQKGFKHNWQGIRVLTYLEKISDKFSGLNLTYSTLWGIINHTGTDAKKCEYINVDDGICQFRHKENLCQNRNLISGSKKIESNTSLDFYKQYSSYNSLAYWTIEGLIVRIADEIAQRHHDLEDGYFARLLTNKQIIFLVSFLVECASLEDQKKFEKIKNNIDSDTFIYSISSLLTNILITDLINQTKENLERLAKTYSIKDSLDFYIKKHEIFFVKGSSGKSQIFDIVKYSPQIFKYESALQENLKSCILNSNIAQNMDGKSFFILRRIIYAYLDNPQQLPDNTIKILFARLLEKEYDVSEISIGDLRQNLNINHYVKNDIRYRQLLMRTICDYIAGMTDDYAIKQYNTLYGTSNVFGSHNH
jgi:dGTPase